MSQTKRNRVSRYAPFDEVFSYDPTENYNVEDFLNLSVTKLQSIACVLSLRNVKRYKKEQLIPLVLQKHEEQQNTLNSVEEEIKKTESEGIEFKNQAAVELMSSTTNDALEFSEQLKKKFCDIIHFKFNNDV